MLFSIDVEVVFEKRSPVACQHFFELRDVREEVGNFLLVGKSHHPFDPRPVVPRAIEQSDLLIGGQLFAVAAKIPTSRVTI